MSEKHLFIAGHGWQKNNTFDPGAAGIITKGEHKYMVEDLFPASKDICRKGTTLCFFKRYNVSNYGNIVFLAKIYGATQVTEFHLDAVTASAKRGHVMINKKYSPDKMDLVLRDVIKSMLGVRYSHKGHEGISGYDNLFNVNVMAGTGISYRLLELGFGTNIRDADILVNQVDEYAKKLVKPVTETKPPNTSGVLLAHRIARREPFLKWQMKLLMGME